MSFFEKMYSLLLNNCHTVHPLVQVDFFNFIVFPRAKRFLKVFICYILSGYEKKKKKLTLFLYRTASINFVQATVVQFSNFGNYSQLF